VGSVTSFRVMVNLRVRDLCTEEDVMGKYKLRGVGIDLRILLKWIMEL
jgi:hypothetical protein